MFSERSAEKMSVLRNLPSVDELVRSETVRRVAAVAGDLHATELARQALEAIRESLDAATDAGSRAGLLTATLEVFEQNWIAEQLISTRRAINATGVIIHTNLGRAPLSASARRAIDQASQYCTLEYDLSTGKRGRRGPRAEELIKEMIGVEDALIVNNC